MIQNPKVLHSFDFLFVRLISFFVLIQKNFGASNSAGIASRLNMRMTVKNH